MLASSGQVAKISILKTRLAMTKVLINPALVTYFPVNFFPVLKGDRIAERELFDLFTYFGRENNTSEPG